MARASPYRTAGRDEEAGLLATEVSLFSDAVRPSVGRRLAWLMLVPLTFIVWVMTRNLAPVSCLETDFFTLDALGERSGAGPSRISDVHGDGTITTRRPVRHTTQCD